MDDIIQAQIEELQQHGEDWEAFFSIEIPDVDIPYEHTYEDDGCEGGACKI